MTIKRFSSNRRRIQKSRQLCLYRIQRRYSDSGKNIRTFHQTQTSESEKIETTLGVFCWRGNRAIEKVGLYIPGGTTPLFSTLLRTAIPAQIAGCEEIIICTPPYKKQWKPIR